ncbi:hypothetical protein FJZ17_00680 [Candidatus Pacearchaeota archaeon]|nr:hypothetical protein [Candidatus Pacearchaeota archaeon]
MIEDVCQNCNRCKSERGSMGIRGANSDKTKVLVVAHMIDHRVFEKDLLGEKGHMPALWSSDSGKALRAMLGHPVLGLGLEHIYFTNVFKGYLKGRMPTKKEYSACLEVFNQQITEFGPRGIVSMGQFAYEVMFPEEQDFANARNKILMYGNVPTLVTFHPSTILKMPVKYRMRVIDFIKACC